ncbi:MepB family protein [Facklamia sp. 7083-14-GEN3]|uniref:MepB family protein n=1 Tax=Facklamia sp. 7083-14-GEN3 TaxID=2973478 RepID=UPI00215B7BCF|nr:MepB family protein [Facklamia sp. 7083-14-GEN3]MCR8969602.1 MepB family protein [Facklamia sp. 7083-14-GEN3]
MKYLKINNWEDELEIIELKQQNSEYEGCAFIFNGNFYRARMAKLTPKKKGVFVAVWQKGIDGKNEPYEVTDPNERLLICVQDGNLRGIFDFPSNILESKGIYQSKNSKGKMGFRLYPSWNQALNETAQKSQKWQNQYFTQL